MEDSTLDNNFNTKTELQIDAASRKYLKETSKWAKFLSIVGFISVGLMILMALFIGTIYSTMMPELGQVQGFPMWIMSAFYILIGILYIMPMLYLYRFATKVQLALIRDDQIELTSSFENLKSLFKFVGIATIIFLGLYAIIIIGTIIMTSIAF